MNKIRFTITLIILPLFAPGLMYIFNFLIATASGQIIPFSLANFYQVGLYAAYAIVLLIGTPLFLLLYIKKIKSFVFFAFSGAAIFPILMLLILIHSILNNEEMSFSNINRSDIEFMVTAIFTGTVLGAIVWMSTIMRKNVQGS